MSSKAGSWRMHVEDAKHGVAVMRRQEKGAYRCQDFLSRIGDIDSKSTGWASPIDAECRFKMADWCYQIVDLCELKRETVAIAVSILDRYVSTESGLHALKCRKDYQLASMTALYMTTKLYETRVMEPAMVSHLSRGSYTEEEVTKMELSMLEALRWRVNGPTALAFVRCFLSLLPSVDHETRDSLFEIARFQTELAVNKYDFVQVDSSGIAFASIANALELVEPKAELRNECLMRISQVASIDDSGCLKPVQVQKRLFHAILNSSVIGEAKFNLGTTATLARTKSRKQDSAETLSPRCVRKPT